MVQLPAIPCSPAFHALTLPVRLSTDIGRPLPQGPGLVCCFSLKNPSHPEYSFSTETGVMCLDFHPQHSSLLAVGCYDGAVMIFDIRNRLNRPIFQSTVKTGKHTDPVWQVRARVSCRREQCGRARGRMDEQAVGRTGGRKGRSNRWLQLGRRALSQRGGRGEAGVGVTRGGAGVLAGGGPGQEPQLLLHLLRRPRHTVDHEQERAAGSAPGPSPPRTPGCPPPFAGGAPGFRCRRQLVFCSTRPSKSGLDHPWVAPTFAHQSPRPGALLSQVRPTGRAASPASF